MTITSGRTGPCPDGAGSHPVLRATMSAGRIVLAAGSGALAVAALPPFSFLLVLPLAFGTLFAMVERSGTRTAFVIGYAFGLGFFGVGLSWIVESFYVEAERFGWMALPAVSALSASLALFPALACGTFRLMNIGGLRGAVVFAACWVGSEWLRGHVLTGFPWNLASYALADHDTLRQAAALVGSYGLGFFVVLGAVLPTVALTSPGVRGRARPALLLVGIVAGLWGYGEVRLGVADGLDSGPAVRIVQGNIPQQLKWDPAYRALIVARYLELSDKPGSYDLLLWPEAAFPGSLEEDARARSAIASTLRDGAVLLTGSPARTEREDAPAVENTILAIDDSGAVSARYAKHHLVPFGEYVPFRSWLPLERLTAGRGEFVPGPGPRTLALGHIPPVGASICYEAVFPGHVVDLDERPDWIFNATNDAWFGTSIGPWQHLASARMRTVEEGLPLVRAANTGISAVIDAYGRTAARLGLGETGIIEARLPPPLEPTPYALMGDWVLVPLLGLIALLPAWSGGKPGRLPEADHDRQHIRGARMIILAGLIGGALWGAWLARKRGGNRLDIAQYAASFGIAFALLGAVLTTVISIALA